ncbi:MAG: preprotein translocase subunit YajC [Ruminococcaceae bacterium]|nr:preprotein translocase subunit YajC [Oscillospiraceae bacterium]
MINTFLLQAAQGSAASPYSSIILMVILVGLMYFMMIRPQKKRQKEEQEMRSALEIGDEIITIGGICGKVVTIRENDIVIETGADRTKMKLQRWAVNTNVTKTEQHRKEVEAAREAAKSKKDKKSKDTPKISDSAKEAEEKIEK